MSINFFYIYLTTVNVLLVFNLLSFVPASLIINFAYDAKRLTADVKRSNWARRSPP